MMSQGMVQHSAEAGFVGESRREGICSSRGRSCGSRRSDDRPFKRSPVQLFGRVPNSPNAIAVGFTGFLILDIGVERLALVGPHLFAIRSFD